MNQETIQKLENVFWQASEDTPQIILDKDKGYISFSGVSMPENTRGFYDPISEWITRYSRSPQGNTTVDFKFEYLNSASSKVLFDIMKQLQTISNNGHSLQINWYYLEEDDDMYEAGEDFAEITGLTVDFYAM